MTPMRIAVRVFALLIMAIAITIAARSLGTSSLLQVLLAVASIAALCYSFGHQDGEAGR